MTVANVNVRQILLKRGNTAVTSQYVGPVGEIVLDTDLETIRVQDGVTPGGSVVLVNGATTDLINSNAANLSAYLSGNVTAINLAIATLQSTVYSNANVAAYLPLDPTITAIQGNLGGIANSISTITGIDATFAANINTLLANAANQEAEIAGVSSAWQANAAVLYTDIQTLNQNELVLSGQIANLSANINSLEANVSSYEFWANANVSGLYADITTANTAIQALQANTDQLNNGTYKLLLDNNGVVNIPTSFYNTAQVFAATNTSLFLGTSSKFIQVRGTDGAVIFPDYTVQTTAYPGLSILDSVNANVTAANTAVTLLDANIGAYEIYANTAITSVDANLGAFETYANASIASINANVGAYETWANANISSLYTSITNTDANLAAANTAIVTLQSEVYSNTNVSAYLLETITTGNIVPAANITYSLGSPTQQWHSLYVSANTIYMGGVPVSVTGNTLNVDGSPIAGNYGNTQVAEYLTTYSGNITADTVNVAGSVLSANGFFWSNGTPYANTLNATSYGQYIVGTLANVGDYQLYTVTGNMPVTNGNTVLLNAGDTYELFASINIRSDWAEYQWQTTGNTLLGSPGISASATSTNNTSDVVAYAIYTPTVDTYVKLSLTQGNSIVTTDGVGSYSSDGAVYIKQIGTTASSAFVGVIQPTYSNNNSYASGTIVVHNNALYQANGAITAGNTFISGSTLGTWQQLNGASSITTYNTITATTTNPYLAGVNLVDTIMVEDDGSGWAYCQLVISYSSPTGSAGSGDYIFQLPAGIQIDTTFHPIGTQIGSPQSSWTDIGKVIPAAGTSVMWTGTSNVLSPVYGIVPASSTSFKIANSPSGTNSLNYIGSNNMSFTSAQLYIGCTFKFKHA